MFLGEYSHNIDLKGRLIVPSKIRENLSASFVVTKGLDNCLFLYNIEDWTVLSDKIKALPVTDKSVRQFVRFFFGGACELEIDAQGRILLPNNLREFAGFNKEIITIGVSNRVEIWAKENYDEYSENNVFDEVLAEKMANLGI
ncbi:MAG: division/cell wall cluster transcriptional repressor MraZ [Lachnospirales bacterium]